MRSMDFSGVEAGLTEDLRHAITDLVNGFVCTSLLQMMAKDFLDHGVEVSFVKAVLDDMP